MTTQQNAELRRLMKKPHKYRARKVTFQGIVFDSERECERYKQLLLLMKGGYIRNLELQVPLVCEVNGKVVCRYIADFIYFEGMTRNIEDTKGYATPLYRLKRKLVEALYNVKILEV